MPPLTDALPAALSGFGPDVARCFFMRYGVAASHFPGGLCRMASLDPRAMALVGAMHRSAVATACFSKFVDRTAEVPDNHAYRMWHTTVGHSAEKFISERRAPDRRPRSVLYPISGCDLPAAVAVFPDADLYVLVDENLFLPGSSIGRSDACMEFSQRREWGNESLTYRVDHTGRLKDLSQKVGILPLMLGKMKAAYPDAQFIRAAALWSEVDGKAGPSHGILVFSVGTGIKVAVYINTYVDHSGRIYLGKDIVDMGFVDGILIKGAQHAFANSRSASEYYHDLLSQNGGVLVEGRSSEGSELSLVRDVSTRDPGAQLSYERSIFFTFFSE